MIITGGIIKFEKIWCFCGGIIYRNTESFDQILVLFKRNEPKLRHGPGKVSTTTGSWLVYLPPGP